MKSWVIHYKNKYPGGRVISGENSLDVYNASGEHCVSLQKGGDGGFHCVSADMGCIDRHDLSPIPKDSRVFKLKDGKIGFDEESESRKDLSKKFAKNGKIQSCEELSKQGFKFDEKQKVLSEPVKAAVVAPQPVKDAEPPQG